ncbi:MAG: dUTP diphosphatase [Lachnospiraceae bacterium]|jgi:dUTP pyrophosphatase
MVYERNTRKINIKKLNENAVIPAYGSEYSAGADLYACLDKPVTIKAGEAYLVHTGFAMEIPEGFAGLIFARSGLATKKGLAPSNKVGVIDADYRGEIMVSLFNHSKEDRVVEPGERIAQLVIIPFLNADWNEVDELSKTVRGKGGFGSTGR